MHDTKNIIHRDIKPLNIMLTEEDNLETVTVIDFGFAVEYKQKNLKDFTRCGTVLYQPPEQAKNMYAYTKNADSFAAGIIAFLLLTGVHPLLKKGDTAKGYTNRLKEYESFNYPETMSV